MDAPDAVHPTDQTLQNYGMGKLDGYLFHQVSRHLEACTPCKERVTELSSDTFLSRLRQARDPSNEAVAGGSQAEGVPEPPGAGAQGGSTEPATTLPAELVDNPDYEIIRELGRGGMGVVYLVHNRLMGRHEAIKVIGRQLMERPIVLDRFLREIRSVARLRHPNVVAAYSATRMGDSIVYAMEYVEGLDLARLVKSKGPLPVTHACYFTHQVALGLQHAHVHGIVHRDIKPGNLILSRTGERPIVKILDFGLTKAAGEDGVDTSLTQHGQMLGTPDYIAPEQTLDAQSVDIRADIYGLGCTLYYLLSGRPPFRGGTLFEVLQAHHSTEATSLNLLRPEVPVELARVVATMMAKKPEDRFQKPAEVAQALAPFLGKNKAVPAAAKPEPSHSVQPGFEQRPPSSGPMQPPAEAIASSTAVPPVRPDSGWGSLVEIGADSLSDSNASRRGSPGFPRVLVPAAVAGVVVVGLFTAWATGLFSSKPVVSEVVRPPAKTVHAPSKEHTVSVNAPSTADPKPAEPAKSTPSPSPPPVVEPPKELANLAPANRKVDTNIAVAPKRSEPALSSRKAISKDLSQKGPIDFRRIAARPGEIDLVQAGMVLPVLDFWPLLTPDDVTAWQVADPACIKMNEHGVVLDAGDALMKRGSELLKCQVLVTYSATEGTEAYVALRAHTGPDGWSAVTSRIDERARTIRAGTQSLDFQVPGKGRRREDTVPGKFFNIEFKITSASSVRVLINGKETSLENQSSTRANAYVGAAGVFVKSGRIIIKALRVSDSD